MDLLKLIVFDMDGVIVDVSASYREAVRQTARLFLKNASSGGDLPDPLFSLADLASVKQAGGLNNDWKLTYYVLTLLMAKMEIPLERPRLEGWACLEDLMPRCDAAALSRYLKSSSSPLTDLDKHCSGAGNAWIECLSRGDVGTGNIIKQIFQELYLGGDLFRQTYGFVPVIHDGKGLIDQESLLIPHAFFNRLSEEHTLALATGRPRAEAEHALNRFNLQPYFKLIYTLDDCLAEEKRIYETRAEHISLGKPHPFMLDAIVQKYSRKPRKLYYVGDMPDDMLAAATSAYPYKGIGILHASPHKHTLKQRLIKAGASAIVDDAEELLTYFS